MIKKHYAFAFVIFLAGCATLAREDLMTLFGTPEPTRFDRTQLATNAVSYDKEVRPILEQRCVVCHSCYDAACQLKLGSYEGIIRGASKEPVYNGTRLLEATPTRLFIDADKASEWRQKGFFPVLNEFPNHAAAEQQASLLARSLDLKARHPMVPNKPAPASLNFSLDRSNQCPTIFEYSDYERKNPQMGMPFGFPAINKQESDLIHLWLQQGAPYEGHAPLTKATEQKIQNWETFFNGQSNREQLVSRYIYEHLFLAHLYFEGETPLQYFRMVRSSTPPGEAVHEIASRRPFEAPGVSKFYYRLRAVNESIVAKSHMPYALSEKRMARWTELFFTPDYRVDTLPAYKPELAANPFKVFEQLPVKARYQFMLDEAEFSIMGFIKGPVCRGQTALNVINDHFWVFFRNPDFADNIYSDYLNTSSDLLTLPSEHTSNSLLLTPLIHYSKQERQFLEEKSNYLEKRLAQPGSVNLSLVWDGGKTKNQNSALTIYRHFDNATVIKGLVGEKPKTAWVINYSLLERIHYLLTAGYDVFGNVGHQVNTRIYMNYLRREGEFNFISLLPQATRISVRDHWYRDADEDIKDSVYGKYAHFNRETDITFTGKDRPDHELMTMLAERMDPALSREYDINTVLGNHFPESKVQDASLISDLQALGNVKGASLQWIPEASFMRLESPGQPVLNFSLLRNTSHLNNTRLLTEEKALVPEENTLDVVPGFATAYPNVFFRVERKDLAEFTRQIAELNSQADFVDFAERFGVRRTSPNFWEISDSIFVDYKKSRPIEAGLFDLNRYENF
jgi:hypothetical protein